MRAYDGDGYEYTRKGIGEHRTDVDYKAAGYPNMCYKNGVLYTCIADHSNQAPPNATYWIDEYARRGIGEHNTAIAYKAASYPNMCHKDGVIYKCIADHTNQTPPNATYWTAVGGSGDGTFLVAKNITGAQINKGTFVMINDEDSGVPAINTKADNTSYYNCVPSGVAIADIADDTGKINIV